MLDEITKLVGIIIAMREPYDHHGPGVAGLALNMARAMELPEPEIALIEVGAHLHDIGKLLVRIEILNAPRRLSEMERAEVKPHAALGWSIVERAGFDPMILDIVRHHHERIDGSGYPDNLRGDEIPMAAQIVGICDVYEALTHARSYRDAYSHNFAMAFIQKDKGKAYDPKLVDLFFAQVAVNG